MKRKKLSREEIQREIQLKIDEFSKAQPHPLNCKAPVPRKADPNQNFGCNWNIDIINTTESDCKELILRITKEVMREYELKE